MRKKRSASSARGKRVAKSVKHILDSQIDFSDIPEATNEQLKRMRRVGRPSTGMAKQLIAIRLSPRSAGYLAKARGETGQALSDAYS